MRLAGSNFKFQPIFFQCLGSRLFIGWSYESEGREFESLRAHHNQESQMQNGGRWPPFMF